MDSFTGLSRTELYCLNVQRFLPPLRPQPPNVSLILGDSFHPFATNSLARSGHPHRLSSGPPFLLAPRKTPYVEYTEKMRSTTRSFAAFCAAGLGPER